MKVKLFDQERFDFYQQALYNLGEHWRCFMGPSIWQILIVVLVVLFIFGPKRIPGLGKSLGEAIKGFRKGIKDDKDGESKDSDTEDKA